MQNNLQRISTLEKYVRSNNLQKWRQSIVFAVLLFRIKISDNNRITISVFFKSKEFLFIWKVFINFVHRKHIQVFYAKNQNKSKTRRNSEKAFIILNVRIDKMAEKQTVHVHTDGCMVHIKTKYLCKHLRISSRLYHNTLCSHVSLFCKGNVVFFCGSCVHGHRYICF